MKPRRAVSIADVVPVRIPLSEGSSIGLGLDVATTERESSNPSALAVVERSGSDALARLVLRWKTANPAVTLAIVRAVLARIAPRRVRRLCIDATSEKFFAAELKRQLTGTVPVQLVVASEGLDYLGERMNFKQFLGNALVGALEDGRLALPQAQWLTDDMRLVKRDRGSFQTDTDASGGHGDAFDALKLALYALEGAGGPATAEASRVGVYGAQTAQGRWRNPLAWMHGRQEKQNV